MVKKKATKPARAAKPAKAAHPNARYKTDEQKKAFTERMRLAKLKNAPAEVIAAELMKPVTSPPPIATVVAALGAIAPFVSPPNKPEPGVPPVHTMARSYLRSGAPGLGKRRGSTYQVTVSLTEDQRNQAVAAAGFRGVSLAELIRSCVVEHLNSGTSSA